ncbi:hypothetical protein FNH22_01215 [Fulvivirga sp. M361]|uniref:hypothetical protein n=1 Tax=Fulvivirga sp. M361 TaxID=2594266 RepID=UPI00117A7DC0|nr:hypothetical protein [Fulvivirga sp. M361]TRX62744.1 hypothetical protein FNH22_01215 [Fulvivirga sp. M361]
MRSPLTVVLVRIFAFGFYRVHSGMLLFSLVTLVVYCLFINVLNQTHFTPEEVVLLNLSVVMAFIESPVVAGLIFLIWLGFTFKSWSYVLGQVKMTEHRFLQYSGTAYSKFNQFKSWMMVQWVISLPLVGYGLFTIVVGTILGNYLLPVIIMLYVLFLVIVSAAIYVKYSNEPVRVKRKSNLSKLVSHWTKPFFSLFLYHCVEKMKVAFMITKVLSWGTIIASAYLLNDVKDDLRTASIAVLGVVTIHTILLYQSYRFERLYLSFSMNFPYRKRKVYLDWGIMYLLMTLPECAWFFITFDMVTGVTLLFFNLGTGMLLRSVLYSIGVDIRKFLYVVFYLFNALFIIILFDLLWVIIPLNLVLSILLFSRNYYSQRPFTLT